MQDQRAIWEALYRERPIRSRNEPTTFARDIETRLRRSARLLELGTGPGNDAAFFASSGHTVIAIDHSETAIALAHEKHEAVQGLTFEPHDIAQPFTYPDGAFDAIYARLSLHYFLDTVTKAIFAELHRLLAPAGVLAFMCKTVDDPLYGQGTEIEPDVYDHDHVRHFFSEAYVLDCLADRFEVLSLVSRSGPLYGDPSAYVEVVASRV